MPSSTNEFLVPESYDHEIGSKNGGGKVGILRLKPSSILWKPKGAHVFYSMPLTDFAEWIKANGKQVRK